MESSVSNIPLGLLFTMVFAVYAVKFNKIGNNDTLSVEECVRVCNNDTNCNNTWISNEANQCYFDNASQINGSQSYHVFHKPKIKNIVGCGEFTTQLSTSILALVHINQTCRFLITPSGAKSAVINIYPSFMFKENNNTYILSVQVKNEKHNASFILIAGKSSDDFTMHQNISVQTESYLAIFIQNMINNTVILKGPVYITKENTTHLDRTEYTKMSSRYTKHNTTMSAKYAGRNHSTISIISKAWNIKTTLYPINHTISSSTHSHTSIPTQYQFHLPSHKVNHTYISTPSHTNSSDNNSTKLNDGESPSAWAVPVIISSVTAGFLLAIGIPVLYYFIKVKWKSQASVEPFYERTSTSTQ